MSTREQILVALAGLVVVSFVTWMAVNKVFLGPAANAEKQAVELQDKIQRARAEKGKESSYRAHFKQLATTAFGTDELRVSEQVRTSVTGLLAFSGLSSQNLSLKPMVGSRVPGVYREIGWSVRARGKIGQVISFLYLLTKEPHLHRLDNVVLSPVAGSTDIELQVKYATLLMEAPKGEKLVTDELLDPPLGAAVLESPDRSQYEVIGVRNLFLPYIPGRPRPAEAPPSPREPPSERPPPPTPEGRYRIVGLPTWGGRTEILVRDGNSGRVANLTSGDDLAGGKIIMVDYRMLPMPKNPEILSGSRVVLQVGNQYYAIELGQSVAEKRPLSPQELPEELAKTQNPNPAPPPAAPGREKE